MQLKRNIYGGSVKPPAGVVYIQLSKDNAGLMLVHRLRLWPNIKPASGQFVCAWTTDTRV